jgi:hypothetical protein
VRPVVRAAVHGDSRVRPVGGHPGQRAAGTAAGGEGAAGGCQGTENKTFGCVPAGCQVTVQTLACPIGVAAPAGPAAGAGPAPPDPAVLAALARQTLGCRAR